MFIQHGSSLANVCTVPNMPPSLPVDLITVLRDPVERLLSQLFFFSGPLTEEHFFGVVSQRNHRAPSDIARDQHRESLEVEMQWAQEREDMIAVKHVWRRLLKDPLSVKAPDMHRLLLFLQSKETGRQGREPSFFPRLSLHCYEVVLGRWMKTLQLHDKSGVQEAGDPPQLCPGAPCSSLITEAVHNLGSFSAVGTTERMPSFFALLSLEYGHPLTDSCHLHNRHAHKLKSAWKKPRLAEMQQGVAEAMKALLINESLIWTEAMRLHEQQLSKHNHTVETATALWSQVCEEKDREGGGGVLTPQMWLNDKRISTTRSSRNNNHEYTRGSSRGKQRTRSQAPSPQTDAGGQSTAVARNIAACSFFTVMVFWVLSRL